MSFVSTNRKKFTLKRAQALNLPLEGARHIPSGKEQRYQENVNLYWEFAQGTGQLLCAKGCVEA